MQIPVQLFQVTGTAIPTLVIAIAIAGRFGNLAIEHWERESRRGRVMNVSMILFVAALVVSGEVASFTAIIAGGGDDIEAMFAVAAVTVLLLTIVGFVIEPLFSVLVGKAGLIAVGVAFLTLPIVAAIVLESAVTSVTDMPDPAPAPVTITVTPPTTSTAPSTVTTTT